MPSTLTVSKAKAQFSGLARKVIKTRESVLIKTPAGYVQLVPFDAPDFVPPAKRGTIRRTEQEIALGNAVGESL
jgi:hypothetical protein